jgi:uncharacterized protein YjbI with pentapeptide repeats
MGRGRTALGEPSQGTVDSLAARVSLIPRLLVELVTHPFGDSTLVRRNGHVLVVRSGADLSGADLSDVDLSRTDLKETNFEGAVLTRANLQGANLAGASLRGAILREANLRQANLEGADLEGCDFSYADLWGVSVDPESLFRAELDGALLDKGALY